MKKIMLFPRHGEFEKAKLKLNELNLQYTVLTPTHSICVPAIVFEQETYAHLLSHTNNDFIFSGCIDYRQPTNLPQKPHPEDFPEDVFGETYIMTASPCVADDTKMRLIAHLSKDIAHTFPYLNTHMKSAFYNKDAEIITFMEQYRLISLYNNKIAIARADEITDAWRMLGKIRSLVNTVYHNRSTITPSNQTKKKPPALDIMKHLPGISCGECGHKTCMAFALSLWAGNANPSQCKPIFEGSYTHLQEAYIELCTPLAFNNTPTDTP